LQAEHGRDYGTSAQVAETLTANAANRSRGCMGVF